MRQIAQDGVCASLPQVPLSILNPSSVATAHSPSSLPCCVSPLSSYPRSQLVFLYNSDARPPECRPKVPQLTHRLNTSKAEKRKKCHGSGWAPRADPIGSQPCPLEQSIRKVQQVGDPTCPASETLWHSSKVALQQHEIPNLKLWIGFAPTCIALMSTLHGLKSPVHLLNQFHSLEYYLYALHDSLPISP